jgi:hypothetical protein
MSMKNSSDTIGSRTRDLSACSALPQPTAPPRAPPGFGWSLTINSIFRNSRSVILILSQLNPLITLTIHYSKAFHYIIPHIHFQSCLFPWSLKTSILPALYLICCAWWEVRWTRVCLDIAIKRAAVPSRVSNSVGMYLHQLLCSGSLCVSL